MKLRYTQRASRHLNVIADYIAERRTRPDASANELVKRLDCSSGSLTLATRVHLLGRAKFQNDRPESESTDIVATI